MINPMEYVNSPNAQYRESAFAFRGRILCPSQLLATFWYHLTFSFNSLACLGCTDSKKIPTYLGQEKSRYYRKLHKEYKRAAHLRNLRQLFL